METIVSKFRRLYKIKIILGYILAIGCLCLCLNYYRDIYNTDTKNAATLFIVIIICFTIAGSLDLLKLTKIIVKQTELDVVLFFTKKITIKYSEIYKIERHKVVQRGDAGQISDGYFISEIILKNGVSFIISPDKFENYQKLMVEIKSNLIECTFA